jgi:hypothetical protein
MGRLNFRDAYEFGPYGVYDAGGLLGMLQAMMHQAQAEAASGLNPRMPGDERPTAPQTPDYGPTPPTRFTVRPFDAYLPMDTETDAGENGLLDRLLALQAEQSRYQPTPVNSGEMASAPPDPNFRQLSRAPFAMQPQGAIGSFNRAEDQSSRPYSSVGGRAFDLPHTSQGDKAAQSDHSFSERVQRYWDHPHPYGLVSVLKGALNNIEQAVQGSIDATSVPSTEEEAFRQNQGRERGPIGAWNALSVLAPASPGRVGGIVARRTSAGLHDDLRSLSPSRTAQGPSGFSNGMAVPAGAGLQSLMRAAPQTSGGLFGRGVEAGPLRSAAPSLAASWGLFGEGSLARPLPPVTLPPITLPRFPDRGRDLWKILQLYLRDTSGTGGGGGDGGDGGNEDGCDEEHRVASEECSQASRNGWKGQYSSGVYGDKRTIEDCVQTRLSERCGGGPIKPKRDLKPKQKPYSSSSRKKR